MDVCDPAIAPGVGTAVKGGLNYREAHVVMEMAAESGRLVALDLVEVNPTLDMRNTTAELGTRAGPVSDGQANFLASALQPDVRRRGTTMPHAIGVAGRHCASVRTRCWRHWAPVAWARSTRRVTAGLTGSSP